MPTSRFSLFSQVYRFIVAHVGVRAISTNSGELKRNASCEMSGSETQHHATCGALPKHAVCGFEGMSGARLVEMLQLCVQQIEMAERALSPARLPELKSTI